MPWHNALIAHKALGAALEDGRAVLLDDEGSDLSAAEDGLSQMLIHAEEPMVKVKDQLGVKRAEIHLL